MWKLTQVERNIFLKLLDDALVKNDNESRTDILNKKIRLPDRKEGLTINKILKVCFY